jgi:predicted aconitase with swiveling domain
VIVTAEMDDPTDFSILGDWIGKQRKPGWKTPFGPIPIIKGLPADLSHEQKKALTAAAANYGCAIIYLEEQPRAKIQEHLVFDQEALNARYEALRPQGAISLVTIGCPQASIGEMKAVAQLLRGRQVTADPALPGEPPPLWIFTSSANKAIAEKTGIAETIRASGALLLENTCPEVVPYDQSWVKQVLTNSMKAEHYIKSGLNGIPTAVMTLEDCLAITTGELELESLPAQKMTALQKSKSIKHDGHAGSSGKAAGPFQSSGKGLPSQGDFTIRGQAFVTGAPITFLGFVNRETGIIEEAGHPADGQSMAGKIAIFPKGSGSSVAPYVLLELFYRGQAPVAIINTEIDQQSAPACSLEGIPYAYDFDADIIGGINNGDEVELRRQGNITTIEVLARM